MNHCNLYLEHKLIHIFWEVIYNINKVTNVYPENKEKIKFIQNPEEEERQVKSSTTA
jgi:hypothetical protein